MSCSKKPSRPSTCSTQNRDENDDIRLHNWETNSIIAFDNPGFGEGSIRGSTSTARGVSVEEKLRKANEVGLQELRFQNDTTNDTADKVVRDDGNGTNQVPDMQTAISNPTYDLAYPEDRGIEVPEHLYASVQSVKEQPKKEYPGEVEHDYKKPVDSQSQIPQRTATDDYEQVMKLKDESLDESHA